MTTTLHDDHVFLNVPFDPGYKPLLEAIVFAVRGLGFVARCALEVDDASQNRLDKVMRLIEECRYGVHDISAVALGADTNLPRFNMPLELGLYLGCKRYGGAAQHEKACLVLDSEPHRYRASLSDIAGQDIHVHGGNPEGAIVAVRNWLVTVSRRPGLPGGAELVSRHRRFRKNLPVTCKRLRRNPQDLTFTDLSELIHMWLRGDR